MNLRKALSEGLSAIVPNTSYGNAIKQTDEYVVYDMDGATAEELFADEGLDEYVNTGVIDLFTKKINKDGSCNSFKKIQRFLQGLDLSFTLNSKQIERETGFTHWEWLFEYIGGVDDGDD